MRYYLDIDFSCTLLNELIMKTNKTNTILWLALILMITLSYFFSEKHIQNAAIFIGVASVIKFLSVGFQFMETKHAHNFWKIPLRNH